MIMWTENVTENCNVSMESSFERMTEWKNCVTSVISLDIFLLSFENVHLACKNSTKANNKKN